MCCMVDVFLMVSRSHTSCLSHLKQLTVSVQDLMFLGFRHQDGDFLYGHEWSNFKTWLSVHVAFSRDHEDKKAESELCAD